jgi:hypothetical protein
MFKIQAMKVWKAYCSVVHHALFLEIVTHELPRGIMVLLTYLGTALMEVEGHARPLTLLIAVAVTLLPRLLKLPVDSPTRKVKKSTPPKPQRSGGKKRSDRPRNEKGQFVSRSGKAQGPQKGTPRR